MALTFGGWPLGWSTGLAGNWGEPEQFVQAGSSTTLLASSDPQRNLADVASWSEHMPVLHSHGHRGETTRFGQLVTMLVDTSATVIRPLCSQTANSHDAPIPPSPNPQTHIDTHDSPFAPTLPAQLPSLIRVTCARPGSLNALSRNSCSRMTAGAGVLVVGWHTQLRTGVSHGARGCALVPHVLGLRILPMHRRLRTPGKKADHPAS